MKTGPIKLRLLVLAAITLAEMVPAIAWADERIVTIGTAGVTGVYYPAGGAICRMVNRARERHGVRCMVESTGGSVNNLEMIRKHDLDLGVAQSDLLYQAYNGSEIFIDVGADKDLRILFSLHSEPFTVIARKDAKINTFNDLRGKRVYAGAPGSGMRATMDELMHRKGWTDRTFTSVDLSSVDAAQALCSGKVDALVYAGGHPNGAVQQITSTCPTRLIDVSGAVIDAMVRDNPFYTRAVIPGGMYKGTDRDVHTFGVDAILVASRNLDEETAYEITKAVFNNIEDFKLLHPVFATLSTKDMVYDTRIAPLHPGALKYYKEKHLISSR
jgi:TRAP transporter TAXI family solute receptor